MNVDEPKAASNDAGTGTEAAPVDIAKEFFDRLSENYFRWKQRKGKFLADTGLPDDGPTDHKYKEMWKLYRMLCEFTPSDLQSFVKVYPMAQPLVKYALVNEAGNWFQLAGRVDALPTSRDIPGCGGKLHVERWTYREGKDGTHGQPTKDKTWTVWNHETASFDFIDGGKL